MDPPSSIVGKESKERIKKKGREFVYETTDNDDASIVPHAPDSMYNELVNARALITNALRIVPQISSRVINSIFLYGFPETEPRPSLPFPLIHRGAGRGRITEPRSPSSNQISPRSKRGLTLSPLNPFTGIWIFHRRSNSFNPFSTFVYIYMETRFPLKIKETEKNRTRENSILQLLLSSICFDNSTMHSFLPIFSSISSLYDRIHYFVRTQFEVVRR